jgi:predicted ATPase
MKLTRRQLATVLAPAAALAQTAVQPQAAAADDELRAARNWVKTNGETLAGQAVPMAAEPAFQFKA